MKLGTAQWIYCGEPLEKTLKRAHSCGLDGVSISGAPDDLDPEETKKMLDSRDLEVSAVIAMPTSDRDFVSPDEDVRRSTIEYWKACTDLASELNADLVNGVPSVRKEPKEDEETEWNWAVEGIKEVGRHASKRDVKLGIEPINRFETFFIRTTEQAIELVDDIDEPNVGLSLDHFHLSIEEPSVKHAIKKAGDKLFNMDVSDTNRRPPGMGQANWENIVNYLREVDYDRYLVLEFLDPVDRSPYHDVDYEYPEDEGLREILMDHGSVKMSEDYYDYVTKFAADYLRKYI
ncbi:hypothetical protein AKJ39_00260 [candidate division MSBL1 archaeon SCGC-AAA259J03]|uniref:Xylose isomerase-like TIM barrel domain-containing protein n=1 Tax=candidate division MSBL1 archaeon SCGC-AAA259J03 TaxID=1698269 RepID=A0A656YXF4_9EURY|nr:hypothetical protein AKJ39_00260 [candidate division MSBL1 archaeon SCGC-AAA259J03]